MATLKKDRIVGIIGLGYVGLPAAVAFSSKFKTIGFDINSKRIKELKEGVDKTLEVTSIELKAANILFTDRLDELKQANFFIVCVPTPVTDAKQPDLTLMLKASETVGKVLKKEDIVVYESTVYPGVTEDDCLPVLEKLSGLQGGIDFKVGYSPERINPGDKEHTFTKIKKVVSAQDAASLEIVSHVYGSVITAGIFEASCIKVAEAAKVIENTQRDLNIALMNELAMIFDLMGLSTREVLAAAATKWNFLKFSPGLVGGHCIGVDPYYLTHKAEILGYRPEVILAGRRINDEMGKFIAQKTIKEMIRAGHNILGSKVTVLGLTFKENCPDLRNTRVIDIIRELQDYGVDVQVCDPNAEAHEALHEYGIQLTPFTELKPSHAVVVAVAHQPFKELTTRDFLKLSKENPVLIDVKSIYSKPQFASDGFRTWSL